MNAEEMDINHLLRSRRDFLRAGFYGLGITAGLPVFLRNASAALAAEGLLGGNEKHPNRILVVVELNGGNDGLNTVVPFANDDYYKNRPTLGIPKDKVLKINDEFGFHPALGGFEKLFKEGQMAIVHGCSYPKPNRSHFVAMEYWHTAVPNGSDSRGWLGRLADGSSPKPISNYLVNVAKQQSMAVKSRIQAPITFDVPEEFVRRGDATQQMAFQQLSQAQPSDNMALDLTSRISANASAASGVIREACSKYQTPVQYKTGGNLSGDMRKVAALIHAGLETRIFYVSIGGWDTHANQTGQQETLLTYTAQAIESFLQDMQRMGRADDVAIMVFTEFGRRVSENASKGTDHGVATPMYVFGKRVKGGFRGQFPSLTDLDQGDLKMTTDFRSVYATMIKEWMGYEDTKAILKGDFPTLGIFT